MHSSLVANHLARRALYVLISCSLACSGVRADSPKTYRNPIIDVPGAADPTVIKYESRYYLYPTLDSRGYDVFVSDDLVHWERKPKCYSDRRGGVWAPDVF